MLLAPARAMVTLESSVSNITCGVTDALGATMFGDCASLLFATQIDPGETAFLRGTFNYHYTDTGLPLEVPQPIQLNRLGTQTAVALSEAAVVYFNSNVCDGRFCSEPSYARVEGSPWALVLGLNDRPDDVFGTFDMFVTLSLPADLPIGYATRLFMGAHPLTFAAAVPEPGTLSLVGAGVLVLGRLARRRRVGA